MKRTSDKVVRLELVKEMDFSYDLVLDVDFPEIAADLKERDIPRRFAIVTDTNVGPHYAGELESALKGEGIEAMVFSFEAGEQNKTWYTSGDLLEEMADEKYGRDSVLIALGGGVVGDTAGFVASVTRRGIPYVQIPTSTLAMADSAVGGKTSVDLRAGKNLAGTFKQPAIVYFNFRTLKTLDERQYRSGFAETIKHSVIKDTEFFRYLEQHAPMILDRNPRVLREIALNNCMIKGTVVEIDDEEQGLRRILNYGHTVGHAIEKLSNYSLPHGECVSIGMMVAGRIAIAIGTGFNEDRLQRQGALLDRFGLPLTIPKGISNSDIIELTALDKKAVDGKARYCLPICIGSMHDFNGNYAVHVDPAVAAEALNQSR